MASLVFLFTLLATSLSTVVGQAPIASAATSCDKVNIVYCGLNGSSDATYVSSFKSFYTSNKSGHINSPTVKQNYTDLQAVYNWAGASSSMVNGLSTSNTALGTLYKDGHITVGGATVGTDAYVTARFSNGSGFTKVEGNVYSRKTTTSFAESSAPVLVVYKSNGQMAFAVMTGCGNAIKATPIPPKVTPPPAASLVCDQLIFNSNGTDNKAFTFTATATAKNTTITNYVFNYGDAQTSTVTTSASSAKANHTYAQPGTYTATVKVNSKDKTNVTSSGCSVALTIAPPAAVLTCDQLTFTNQGDTYSFTAKASAQNTTITNYSFSFGDNSSKVVTTGATTATASHTYATPGTYTAYVTVSSKEKPNVTSAKCAVQITIPQPMCTIPGKETLPANSPECVETPVVTCDQLVISQNGANTLAQSFIVQATAQHATITSYSVDFGDKTTAYSGAANAVNHTYAAPGTYNVTASVTATANGQTITKTSVKCAGTVTIPQPMCTVPGKENLPANSADCKETPPPVTPPTTPPVTPPVTPPTVLPNTGAGNVIGLFAGVTIAGAAFHRLFASRRLFGLGR
ncbi:MAG: PKD domain-containing protein [Candidatus Saccharibacteria bacterium]